MKFSIIIISFIALFASCQNTNSNQEQTVSDNHQIIVKEVLQTVNYTYLKADENGTEIWVAIPLTQAEVGEKYFYKNGMEMLKFESKELKRTFDKVLFLEGVSKEPITAENKTNQQGENNQNMVQGKPFAAKTNIAKIEPVAGGITIAELFSKKDSYNGKTIKIRGQVVKFTESVMNTNWIHIQDGTTSGEDFDLAVASNINTKIGDIITVQGKIILDKDFGSGYFYKVLLENAVEVK